VKAAAANRRGQVARMINGAEAMAIGYDLAGVRLSYSYPITPQVEVMEAFSRNTRITAVQADSEYNVLAGAQGVAWAGERCAVATSSQGLILMSEVMWEVAGNRLPLVMGVFNRALKGPGWCLGAHQNDTLFMRDTGWLQFYCETAQEVLDLLLIAFRVAEEVSLPAMVAGDGFYLSHETEEVLIPERREALAFVGERVRHGPPMTDAHANYGGLVPPARYFRFYQRLHHDVARAATVFEAAAAEFADRFGRRYTLAAPTATQDAECVVVSAGTICGTVRDVVERRRAAGDRVGLVKLHSFRPFPGAALVQAVGSASRVIVLDRNLAPGLGGVFAAEARLAFRRHQHPATIYSMVTGLGGSDVTPETVERALEFVARSKGTPPETLFLHEGGIEE
jgi:pyruvate ferredoxin oxidoreductase alpha subunit